MKRTTLVMCGIVALFAFAGPLVSGEGLASNVLAIDQKKQQLSLDWMNDTAKIVHWNHDTKFSVLETGAASKSADIHVGSYLRIKGEDQGDTFVATEIVIWLAESKPAPPPK